MEILGFLAPSCIQLLLRLVEQIREHLDDASAMALVDGSSRRTYVVLLTGALHQGRKALGIGRAERRSLDQHAQGLRHARGTLQLQHGCAAFHLALQDANCPPHNIDGLRQLFLLCQEGVVLRCSDLPGSLEIRLVDGELPREFFDLCFKGADRRNLLRDSCLQFVHLRFAGLDLVAQGLRTLFAPLRKLFVDLLRAIALLQDLGLEV
mmetsp:Transcript_53816/g.135902  ORF Transcript_53816/g.135902 Transcript_53816/m.135902 type:complete len:208 (-) Transcript_53816:162-785(-)